ncbi:MAG: hypothetical protein ACRD2L_14400, partial [Terriglobia bacterium]
MPDPEGVTRAACLTLFRVRIFLPILRGRRKASPTAIDLNPFGIQSGRSIQLFPAGAGQLQNLPRSELRTELR